MWTDKVFGLKSSESLMTWLKISPKLENLDENLATTLADHFQISQTIIEDFVRVSGNLLADCIDAALSTFK